MNFKEKVQSMTIKEIVLAMVHGLEKEHVKINMATYGNSDNGICYGCAATNAICEIHGSCFRSSDIGSTYNRAKFLGVNASFLSDFERAIDRLRRGNLRSYNMWTDDHGISKIPFEKVNVDLPALQSSDYKKNLHYYKEFAETL